MGGGKSGLVSTVCACANDSGNFLRTSPIMDKLHVVVMRRNNQTRYTAYSVAADFTRRWLPLSETQGVTRQGLRYNYRQFHRHCACSWNKRQSRSRWTSQIPWVATEIRLYHRRYSAFNVKFTFPIQQRANLNALSKSSLFTWRARDKFEADVLRSYTVKINGS